jgi:hypothetical protein
MHPLERETQSAGPTPALILSTCRAERPGILVDCETPWEEGQIHDTADFEITREPPLLSADGLETLRAMDQLAPDSGVFPCVQDFPFWLSTDWAL